MPILAGVLIGFLVAQGEKPQGVRVFDVMALGPYMIALGARSQLTEGQRQVLQFAGALTIGYNARNLLENLGGTDV
jgi:hypothetical protein